MVPRQPRLDEPDSAAIKVALRVERIKTFFRSDPILSRVLRNTGYLFSSRSLTLFLSMVQSVFAGRLLGAELFGIVGIITSYVSTVNRLFSFRMGELIVRYLGEHLEAGEKEKAAAVAKAAMLTEGLTSLAAYFFLLVTASLAARYVTKDTAYTPLIMLYGLTILGNITYETSTGILQVTNHFRSQAALNLVQSILTAAVIFAAYLMNLGLEVVVWAYLIGKVITGVGVSGMGWYHLNKALGRGWWKAPFSLLENWKELRKFALTSNFSATVNMVVRDSEVMWVGLLLNPLQAGYYKVAFAIINLISVPFDPVIAATYPEINRLTLARNWQKLRQMLRKLSTLALGLNLAVSAGIVLFGRWLLGIYGAEFTAAYPALLILLAGFAFNYTLYWNRPLLLALGLPEYPFKATLWTGIVKVLLSLAVVPGLGYLAQAGLLSMYYIISVGLIVRRGFAEIRTRERMDV